MPPIDWVCPECRGPLEPQPSGRLHCPRDDIDFGRRDGTLSLITEDRFEHYRRFPEEYRSVRHDEDRGFVDVETYRTLPLVPPDHRHRAEWKIRAISFSHLLARVVRPLAERRGPLAVADLGAGNGWLSRRLAMEDHRVVAVDILTDETDGLGAHGLSEIAFDTVQAEFDRLPLADKSLDLVIFNGALHYSTDYHETLEEALRVLRPGGVVAALDSPFYRDADSGWQMIEERRLAYFSRYGFGSNSIPCRGFLTFDELDELALTLDLSWRIHRPFYGLRWALRPLGAVIRGRREPATFLVLWAEK